MDPEAIRARYEHVRQEVGPDVTVVAATKYVSVEGMAALVDAGIEVVGENRLQDLEAKHAAHGTAFRWHFIGHLQSRKAARVSELCELVHSLDSASAAERLTVPALVQVNLSGEETKSGVSPADLEGFVAQSSVEIKGLSTMPPLADDPEASRPYFRRLRRARGRPRTDESFRWERRRTTASRQRKGRPTYGSARHSGKKPDCPCAGGRLTRPEAPAGSARSDEEGGSWGKHGFPHVTMTACIGSNIPRSWAWATSGIGRSSTSALPRSTTTAGMMRTSPTRSTRSRRSSLPARMFAG